MINEKVLVKKLKQLSQEIITDCVCECGKPINYILIGRGYAGTELHYEKFNTKLVVVCGQDGKRKEGFTIHMCKSKASAEE